MLQIENQINFKNNLNDQLKVAKKDKEAYGIHKEVENIK